MKKIMMILGVVAMSAMLTGAAVAADNICEDSKVDIVKISPKVDVINSIPACDPAKKDMKK